MKRDPLYAIGYDHGMNGLVNQSIDSEAYSIGREKGAEAKEIFARAGFKQNGSDFSLSLAVPSREVRTSE